MCSGFEHEICRPFCCYFFVTFPKEYSDLSKGKMIVQIYKEKSYHGLGNCYATQLSGWEFVT